MPHLAKPCLHIGLTGGIGSGKSTLGAMLSDQGAALIDADQIARSVTAADGAAIEPIRAHFGNPFIDASGAMDRARMRALRGLHPDDSRWSRRRRRPRWGSSACR